MTSIKIILILSGEISGGKSCLANSLVDRYGFHKLSSREGIIKYHKLKGLKSVAQERLILQKAGDSLDKKTSNKWLLEVFQNEIIENDLIVLDSARKIEQINHFRRAYGHRVYHIHLKASDNKLFDRFKQRHEIRDLSKEEQLSSYKKAKKNLTEKRIGKLESPADFVLDTEKNSEDDNLVRVSSSLKLLSPLDNPLVDLVVGGQFGSEGKGQISAYLSTEYDCLIRTGGPNAGHTVYAEPEHHVFHHLPSGSVRAKNSKIVLGPGTVINVETLFHEINKYNIDSSRILIDNNATIITQKDIEKEKEIQKIGSTSQGVGMATSNNIINRLLERNTLKAQYCKQLNGLVGSSNDLLESLFSKNKRILLEGTQGTLLSLHNGFYPYVTSRDTTASGLLAEAGISPKRVRKIILVFRVYPIRVQSPPGGTSGPFYSKEITLNDIADRSGLDIEELKKTELTTTTRKPRRIAEFSWSLFRKSCELNSPTDISLTFADYINKENREARRYELLDNKTKRFIEELELCSGRNVNLIATRFNYRSIIDRRNWK